MKFPPLLQYIFNDLSTWVLIATNIITITAAYLQHWSFSTIIWVYWIQTLIIGLFAFLRAVSIADLTPVKTQWLRLRLRGAGGLRSGLLFLSHFTIVQGCLTFILWMLIGPVTAVNSTILLSSAVLYFGNHLFSYVYHVKRDPALRKNIGLSLLRPYLRLLPLLVSFLFAGIIIAAFYLMEDQQLVPVAYLVLFVLKTGADVIAHTFEHGVPHRRKKRAFETI
jgi:hypothetical protein